MICLNTSADSTQHVHSPYAITEAVRLSFIRRAISPNPIMFGLALSSFSILISDSRLGSEGKEPGS